MGLKAQDLFPPALKFLQINTFTEQWSSPGEAGAVFSDPYDFMLLLAGLHLIQMHTHRQNIRRVHLGITSASESQQATSPQKLSLF